MKSQLKKTVISILVGLTLLNAFFSEANTKTAKSKRVQISALEEVPKIDGKLDPVWRKCACIKDFEGLNGKKLTQNTDVYLGYTEDSLYIAFVCHEDKMNQMIIAAKGRDSTIYGDDCAEVFIDANNDLKTYFQFQVNPNGAFTDRKCEKADTGQVFKRSRWNGKGVETAAGKDDNYWVAELKIPFSALEIKWRPDLVMGINITRAEYPHKETSSWSQMGTTYHDPKLFNRCWFRDGAFIDRADVVSQEAGTMKIKVIATNTGSQSLPANLVIKYTNPQEGEVKKVVKIDLKPKETKDFLIEQPTGYGGNKSVTAELWNRKNTTKFDARRISLPTAEFNLSEEFTTPHTPWAKPTRGGKIKVLFLLRYLKQRDVIELAQRMDLDYISPIFIRRYWTYPEKPTAKEYLDKIRKALDKDLDVIVLDNDLDQKPGQGRLAAAPMTGDIFDKIKKKVEQGTGLILYAQKGVPKIWQDSLIKGCDSSSWRDKVPVEVKVKHYLTNGIPFSFFNFLTLPVFQTENQVLATAGNMSFLAVNTYEKGRIIILGSGKNGMVPLCPSGPTYKSWGPRPTHRYWDYYFAFMAKCIFWASGRNPDIEIDSLECKPAKLSWSENRNGAIHLALSEKGKGGNYQVELTIRNKFSDKILSKQQPLIIKQAETKNLTFKLPENVAMSGIHFAEIIIKKNSVAENWGITTFTINTPVKIVKITPKNGYIYKKDEALKATISFQRDQALSIPQKNLLLEIILKDRMNRIIGSKSFQNISPESKEINIEIPLHNPIWRTFHVEAVLKSGKKILDKSISDPIYYIPEREFNKFGYFVWNWSFIERHPDYAHYYFYRRLLECGFNGIEGYYSLDFPIMQAFRFSPKNYPELKAKEKEYKKTKDPKHLIRTQCFNDPKTWEKLNQSNKKSRIDYLVPQKPIGYMFGDENYLAPPGVDICFSECCLKEFRNWLKKHYENLNELNKEWDTDFKSWEDIMPMTKEQVRNRGNYAPWADHRHFMSDTWTSGYAKCKNWLLKYDPEAKVGNCGTRPLSAYTGIDWYKLLNVFTFLTPYSIVKNQAEVHRSFSSCPKIMASGLNAGKTNTYYTWKAALNDCFGIIFSKTSYALTPDLAMTAKAYWGKNLMGELTGGLGKILLTSTRDQGEVAIYYSPASCFGIWMNEYRFDRLHQWRGPFHRCREAWLKLVQDLGLQYRFIHPEQVKQGSLEKSKIKVLILPYALAMSDKEVQAIKKFVENGGSVIADYLPAVMDWHCRFRDHGGLDTLFGVDSKGTKTDLMSGKVKFNNNILFKKLSDKEITSVSSTPGVTAKAGKVLAEFLVAHSKNGPKKWPAIITNNSGKGYSYYFNFLYDYRCDYMDPAAQALNRNLRTLIKDIFGKAGVSAPLKITAKGIEQSYFEVIPYNRGKINYFFILRDYLFPPEQEEFTQDKVTVSFPVKGHIYNLRTKKYLGHTQSIETVLKEGEPMAFALVPYKIESLNIQGPEQVSSGDIINFDIQIKTNTGSAGDQVIRVEIFNPDGKNLPYYSKNLLTKSGKTTFSIPSAVNENSGKWKITATDVISGIKTEKTFIVKK